MTYWRVRVIDVLALRVGGEKGEDEADTVGCCSLRVEHMKFNPFVFNYYLLNLYFFDISIALKLYR